MADVILDTNIILDYLSATRERHVEAVNVLEQLLESDVYEPVILAAGIKDAYYILCRHFGANREELVRERLDAFRQVVSVAELTYDVVDRAFASNEPDLEDGIVRATAELRGAAAIVTRDRSAYESSSVPSMTAKEFLQRMSRIAAAALPDEREVVLDDEIFGCDVCELAASKLLFYGRAVEEAHARPGGYARLDSRNAGEFDDAGEVARRTIAGGKVLLEDLAGARSWLAQNKSVAQQLGNGAMGHCRLRHRDKRFAREQGAVEDGPVERPLNKREIDLAAVAERDELCRVAGAHEDVIVGVTCEVRGKQARCRIIGDRARAAKAQGRALIVRGSECLDLCMQARLIVFGTGECLIERLAGRCELHAMPCFGEERAAIVSFKLPDVL